MRTPRTPIGALLLVAAALPGLATSSRAADVAETAATPAIARVAAPAGDTYALATADRSAAGCPAMRFSNLQRRVLHEADRGEEPLRRYVNRTRMLHQLDLLETARWVDQVRARNADCRTAITAMAP